MILAAGFGTRLRPLTFSRPKALVPIANRPLLEYAISYLASFGVCEIMVNAHHLWEQIQGYLETQPLKQVKTHISIEREILGTGGALKKVDEFWGEGPFVVFNVDVLTNVDLHSVLNSHKESGALATLVLHHHPLYNLVETNRRGEIVAFHSTPSEDMLAFTGIHVISPEILQLIPSNRYSSIIDCYRNAISLGLPIKGHICQGIKWLDVGTIDSYVQANRARVKSNRFLIGNGTKLAGSAKHRGRGVIGNNCSIGKGAILEDSILWDNVTVREGVKVIRSIVTDNKIVEQDLVDHVI